MTLTITCTTEITQLVQLHTDAEQIYNIAITMSTDQLGQNYIQHNIVKSAKTTECDT